MAWKSVLKNIEMDDTEACCEEARLSLVQWFEEHADKLEPNSGVLMQQGLRNALLQTANDLSLESCEELEASIERFQELYDLERSNFFDNKKLEEIMLDWDRCSTLGIQRMNNRNRPQLDIKRIERD